MNDLETRLANLAVRGEDAPDLPSIRRRAQRRKTRQARRAGVVLATVAVAVLAIGGITAVRVGLPDAGVGGTTLDSPPTNPTHAASGPTPTATEPTPTATEPSDRPPVGRYEVQPADTWSSIAMAVYGDPTKFGAIMAANGISDDHQPLQVGQVLLIPVDPDVGVATAQPEVDPAEPARPLASGSEEVSVVQVHVVQRGESLSGIAQQVYGNEACHEVLADVNGVGDRNPLQVGQELVIPDVPMDAACRHQADSISPGPEPTTEP